MSGQRRLLDYHRRLVDDEERLSGFARAIQKTVKAGDIVLDLGAGAGILSLLAARAGARHVYAIERSDIARLAVQVVEDNGARDRVSIIGASSSVVRLPELADVVIAYVGLDEGLLASFIDARDRLAKRTAQLLPSRVQLCIAPVHVPELYARTVAFWNEPRHGFDHRALRRAAAHLVHPVQLEAESFRSAPQPVIDIDLRSASTVFAEGECEFLSPEPQEIHGIGAWFRAELADGEWQSSVPPNRMPTWSDGFFPLEMPIAVGKGDAVRVALMTYDGRIWRWRVSVRERGTGRHLAEFDHSTFGAFPIDVDVLRSESPRSRPRLSLRGRLAIEILRDLDGTVTLEQLVSREPPDLFPTRSAWVAFVHKLVAAYASDRADDG